MVRDGYLIGEEVVEITSTVEMFGLVPSRNDTLQSVDIHNDIDGALDMSLGNKAIQPADRVSARSTLMVLVADHDAGVLLTGLLC